MALLSLFLEFNHVTNQGLIFKLVRKFSNSVALKYAALSILITLQFDVYLTIALSYVLAIDVEVNLPGT